MAILGTPAVALTPSPTPEVTSTNYISTFDFSDENLPQTVKDEFQRYGNQSVKGFLEKTASEMPISSDKIIWSEQTRLRNIGTGLTRSSNVFSWTAHPLRVNEVILINDGAGNEDVAHVTAIDTDEFTAVSVNSGGYSIGTTGLTLFSIGSEFAKGTNGMASGLESPVDTYENSPVIIKEIDVVNGSDTSQIGWIEVDTEDGTGYFYYLKSRSETRQRFDDNLELSMIEGRNVEAGSDAATAGKKGTEGFFEAVEEGNIFSGVATTTDDFDDIIERLDAQGAVEENMLFLNRGQSRAIDEMLASQNSYGVGGTSYGVFGDEETALNLQFQGFKYTDGYDFYKTSWKYLNDPTTRGAFTGAGKVNGVLVPASTKNVYDEIMGEKVNMPHLHVKYRSDGGAEDRRYKSWMTGSVLGVKTDDLDANKLHLLSERALCTMGRNQFVLFRG